MTIVEGKIIDSEQAKSVGQNQNWAQNITIEDKQGRQLTGEILVKQKNIVQAQTTEYIKWEVSQSDYGPKLKRHRETAWQGGGQGGGQRGSKPNIDRLIVAQVVYKAILEKGIEVVEADIVRHVDMIMRIGAGQPAPQGGDPNPDYQENPDPIEDADEIPF